MTRVPFSSAATHAALLGLLLIGSPAATAAQGARQRGGAPAQGQAVPRGQTQQTQPAQPATGQGAGAQGGRQAVAQPQRAPQPQRSVEPQRSAPQQRIAPPRAVQSYAGTAVPRTVPRAARPNNDNPVYRPNYQPNYRGYGPSYRPPYGPVYPAYRPVYRPYSLTSVIRLSAQRTCGSVFGWDAVAYLLTCIPAVSYAHTIPRRPIRHQPRRHRRDQRRSGLTSHQPI